MPRPCFPQGEHSRQFKEDQESPYAKRCRTPCSLVVRMGDPQSTDAHISLRKANREEGTMKPILTRVAAAIGTLFALLLAGGAPFRA